MELGPAVHTVMNATDWASEIRDLSRPIEHERSVGGRAAKHVFNVLLDKVIKRKVVEFVEKCLV
jgi:hypothetical protein